MTAYFARRIGFAIFLVLAVSSASLILARLAPGDYVTASVGVNASRESIERARERYGLNKPLGAQYWDWLSRAARLDFGESMLYDRPVGDLIPARAANTAILSDDRSAAGDGHRFAARRHHRQPP